MIPSALPSPVFPSLARLRITADFNLELGIQLVKFMSPGSALSSISITTRGFPDTRIDVSEWSELLSAIQETCCTRSLQRLYISDYHQPKLGIEAPVASPGLQLHSDQLKCLFPFANLTELDLSTYHGFDLNDGLIQEMVIAWPKLQIFRLASACKSPSDLMPPLTLSSLIPFAQYFRCLSLLAITINAHVVLNTTTAIKISNHTLHTLDIGLSPITSVVVPQVAALLSDLFPNLTKILNHRRYFREDEQPPYESSDKAWCMVETLTKTFARVREEEFRRVKALVPEI
ncbi:hypothetical protein C0989_001195 [Termitomyces sp. Mn162]|nr:hypothetical protein C0989_001195 [Termitomyces sp. Mn162]